MAEIQLEDGYHNQQHFLNEVDIRLAQQKETNQKTLTKMDI